MTHRERILTSLSHKEPDKIPIDLGGMDSTGITAIAYNRLKNYLGIKKGKTQVYEPYQQVVKVERDIIEIIGADILPLLIEPKRWKRSILPDGSECEIPEKWNPVRLQDGSYAVYDNGKICAMMPEGSYYFEPVNPPLKDADSTKEIERKIKYIKSFDWPAYWDEDYEDLERKAKYLYKNTDYAIFGNLGIHLFAAGQILRGFDQFLIDLVLNKKIAHCILQNLTITYMERIDRYCKAVGNYIQVINVNDDLGMETGPLISPELYREMIKPYQKKIYGFIKEKCKAYLFLHTDGSVYEFIPDFIEIGVDILNPVQFTCKNMELYKLKREFGKYITFWGGGCDTQKILPFEKPDRIKEHVKECISILAPGGGFVFCQVHNIQPDVPPENIMAMYEAVKEWT